MIPRVLVVMVTALGACSDGEGTKLDEPSLPSANISCGEGTTLRDGFCESLLTCGVRTELQGTTCVGLESLGLSCGEGTIEDNGQCVSDPAGVVTCGLGTVLEGQECVPDTGALENPPNITVVSRPSAFASDQTGNTTFSTDKAVHWRVEVGGGYPSDGVLLDSGDVGAETLVTASLEGSELGAGRHEIRIYAWPQGQGMWSAYAVQVFGVRVVGDMRLRVFMGVGSSGDTGTLDFMLESDARVSEASTSGFTSGYYYDPPTVADLLEYDAVVLGWNYCMGNPMRTQWGNVMAAYLAAGGALVYWHARGDCQMTGAFTSGGYSATSVATTHDVLSAPVTPVILDAGHPILAGVSELSLTWRPNHEAHPSAELIAKWSDDTPLVLTRGAAVALGITVWATDTALEGDWATLIVNAAQYAVSQAEL